MTSYNVETANRNYKRETLLPPGEKWTVCGRTEGLQKGFTRYKGSATSREELPEKANKPINDLDRLQDSIQHGSTFVDPKVLKNDSCSSKHHDPTQ